MYKSYIVIEVQLGLREEENEGSRGRWRKNRVGSIDGLDLIRGKTDSRPKTPLSAEPDPRRSLKACAPPSSQPSWRQMTTFRGTLKFS